MKIVSVAEMRALEAAAFAAGVSEAELQQRAGTGVAEAVFGLLQPGERVLVLAGHGNNGRDGMVAAVWLLERGCNVDLALGPRHAITDAELARVTQVGGQWFAASEVERLTRALDAAAVVVDALAGIGTHGALREPLAGLVRRLNETSAARADRLSVVAIDVPSGIDADTGEDPGEVVWADVTVTLGAVKQGLLRFPGAERVGRLVAHDIGLDDAQLAYSVLLEDELAECVPRRPADAHKYRFGRVLVVAGSDHFLGAPVLCAGGALRAGAGLVTLATTPAARQAVVAHLPEAIYTQGDPRRVEDLEAYLESQAAIVVGPGLGRDRETVSFVHDLLRAVGDKPLVVDADGLYALGELDRWWDLVGPNTVLTPHTGELNRLRATFKSEARQGDGEATGADGEGRRGKGGATRGDSGAIGASGGSGGGATGPGGEETAWAQAGRLASAWGCCLVAKGPFTCIARPDGRVAVWPRANPALATGGTGDVLAGLCGGLLAQGASAWDAARLAVAAHGMAGATIVEQRGWRTLLASDLLTQIPAALAQLAPESRPVAQATARRGAVRSASVRGSSLKR